MRKKKNIILLMFIIITILLCSCGSAKDSLSKKSVNQSATEQYSKVGNEVGDKAPEDKKKEISNLDRKVVKSCNILLETLTFDNSIKVLVDKCIAIGGYVESSNIMGKSLENKDTIALRSGELVLKIPKKEFDGFISMVGGTGNIVNKSIIGEDVTSQYFDTEARLKSLKIQEERLLSLLSKASQLKDIIDVERELTTVRYEIENLTGTLKKWDNLIDFSTVTISIREVDEISKINNKPSSLSGKIYYSFMNSLKGIKNVFKGFLVVLAYVIPYLIIIITLYIIIKKILKKKNVNIFKKDKKE